MAFNADSVSEQKLDVCDLSVKTELESSDECELDRSELFRMLVSISRVLSSTIVFSEILLGERKMLKSGVLFGLHDELVLSILVRNFVNLWYILVVLLRIDCDVHLYFIPYFK